MQPGSCSLRVVLAFDRYTSSRSPFGRRTVVIALAFRSEQVALLVPRVAGTFPDKSVRAAGAAAIQVEVLDVNFFEFSAGLKASVFLRGHAPRDGVRGRNMPRAQRSLFRVVRRSCAAAGEFVRGAHIDEGFVADRI